MTVFSSISYILYSSYLMNFKERCVRLKKNLAAFIRVEYVHDYDCEG